jgi:tetratricopeptide (TPR) repeat protein
VAVMRLALLLATSSALAFAQQSAPDAARTIASWREALELDLPAEVLGPGPAAVAPDGPLKTEGEAIALVARALFDAGREAEAKALLDAARPSEPTRAHVELERVRELLELDQLDAALAAISESGDPPRPKLTEPAQSWHLLGRTLVRLGRGAEAVPCLERYLELDPLGEGAYSALHMLSQEALRRGDGQAAKQLVGHAQEAGQWWSYYRVRRLQVREQPDEPLPRLGLAQLLLQAGQNERAMAVLNELVERCPTYGPGWFHLAEVLRSKGRWEEAKAAYDKALELDPDLPLARYNRAVLLMRSGNNDAARADLEQLVAGPYEADPRVVSAHLALARLLLASGDREGAQKRHSRYLQLGGTEPLEP